MYEDESSGYDASAWRQWVVSLGTPGDSFDWPQWRSFNIASACLAWADDYGDLVAVEEYSSDPLLPGRAITYAELAVQTGLLATALARCGITRGDRVGILLNQCLETPVAHLATYSLGAVVVPLTVQVGDDALAHRLNDSLCDVVFVDSGKITQLLTAVGVQPLKRVIVVGSAEWATTSEGSDSPRTISWNEFIGEGTELTKPVQTRPTDIAIIAYTSGTSGRAKGAVHAHQVLWGYVSALKLCYDGPESPGATYWTPVDWAWLGGAYDVLIPALAMGGRVIAGTLRPFEAEACYALLSRTGITHSFLPPTALRMLTTVSMPSQRYGLALETVITGGEEFTSELLEWARRDLPGTKLHEIYGQTEANPLIGNDGRRFPVRPGSFGKPFPGHEIRIVNGLPDDPVGVGEVGEIIVRALGDPSVLRHYWRSEDATADKIRNGWLYTGDLARVDSEGYFEFISRADDVIITSGYRVGPAEIEEAISSLPEVEDVAVVSSAHAVRGNVIRAFVVLTDPDADRDVVRTRVENIVKSRIAFYAYPREVSFVAELPRTTTGKLSRAALREMALEGGQL